MATRRIQLKEFPSTCLDYTLCIAQDCCLCWLLRFWHKIMATVSHWHQNLESQEAPRHVQCAARLRPYITALIFHIKGHDLTLIVRQVGGVLMSSRTNVFTDASFWPNAALSCLRACSSPRAPPTPAQLRKDVQINIRPVVKMEEVNSYAPKHLHIPRALYYILRAAGHWCPAESQ